MPYAQSPSVKKLSKMNTLLLARNYILLLRRSTEELKHVLAEVCVSATSHPSLTSSAVIAASVAKRGGHRTSLSDKLSPLPTNEQLPILLHKTNPCLAFPPLIADPRMTHTLPLIYSDNSLTTATSPSIMRPRGINPNPVITPDLTLPHNMSTNIPCPCPQCITSRTSSPASSCTSEATSSFMFHRHADTTSLTSLHHNIMKHRL